MRRIVGYARRSHGHDRAQRRSNQLSPGAQERSRLQGQGSQEPRAHLAVFARESGRPCRRDFQAEVAARKARENAVTAHWGLLLANDVTLSIVPSPQRHDLTITMTSTGPKGVYDVAVRKVEVRDREGRVLLRRQHVTATRMFVPLLVLPHDSFGGGNAGWELARMDLATRDRLNGINSITALFNETTLARPPEPGAAVASMVASMRDRLAAALMQPGAPADLSLADPWIATINWQSINDEDIELLGKLIADTRVTDLPSLYERGISPVRAELRGAIVARLINPATLPQLRNRLDPLVRYMPPGTFAVSTPDELTLLHNPLLRMNAPGLVERLADQGKAGAPELVRILQEDVRVEPWTMRQDLLKAVRRALTRLGPDAASALLVVVELFDQGGTLLAPDSSERGEWRIAMVRMGRPVEDVPLEPGLTAEQIAQRRTDLMRSVEWARDHPELDPLVGLHESEDQEFQSLRARHFGTRYRRTNYRAREKARR